MSNIQQLLDSVKHQIDSLTNCNNSLQLKVKSLQDSIASLQKQVSGGQPAEDNTGDHAAMIFLVILCLALLWWMYRHFKKKKEKCMLEKKDFEVNYEDDNSSFSSLPKEKAAATPFASVIPCIVAAATDTRKPKNQDSYTEAFVEKRNAHIVAIADGVGSSYKSEVGSRFVTEKAVELIKEAIEKDENQIDFDSIFDEIQAGLDKKIEQDYADELSAIKPSSFGTTLIVGIDFPERFVVAYIGNGSVWHISGFFNSFPKIVSLPWNAVNLLKPDTVMSGGKEALYKIFFYKGERKHHKPTVLQVSKLREAPGDIFILTTDGVYSSDHAIAAKDDEGEIWIPSTAQFGVLMDGLKGFVEGKEDINNDTLKQMLVNYLAQIKETKIMDDDTTLGIFISPEAKTHLLSKRKDNEAN